MSGTKTKTISTDTEKKPRASERQSTTTTSTTSARSIYSSSNKAISKKVKIPLEQAREDLRDAQDDLSIFVIRLDKKIAALLQL